MPVDRPGSGSIHFRNSGKRRLIRLADGLDGRKTGQQCFSAHGADAGNTLEGEPCLTFFRPFLAILTGKSMGFILNGGEQAEQG